MYKKILNRLMQTRPLILVFFPKKIIIIFEKLKETHAFQKNTVFYTRNLGVPTFSCKLPKYCRSGDSADILVGQ